jgi:hypothetical protein
MGCRCLTDGIWVWPEGLAHYVDFHDVYLPEEFISTMRQHGWRMPEGPKFTRHVINKSPDGSMTLTTKDIDHSFWIEWAAKQVAMSGAESPSATNGSGPGE